MRILFLCNRVPYPLNDGGNIATFSVADGLAKLGHEVHIAALNTNKHWIDPTTLPNSVSWHTVDINTDLKPMGLIGGMVSSFPYNVKRFESAEFRRLLQELLREIDFDVVQAEGIYMGIYIGDIRKNSTAPIVLRSHNIEHRIWERLKSDEKSLTKSTYLSNLVPKIRKFEEQTFGEFDGIIAITKEDENWYWQRKFKGKLTTINAGVDRPRFSRRGKENTLAFIGSLEWLPNTEGIIWFLENVWPIVRSQNPEATFHVAGKKAPKEIEELMIEGLEFHGMVPDAQEFVSAHSVFVVPLKSGSGMRLKIVEAMALGMPVVSTTIGAEGIPIVNGKHFISADDPESMAKEIIGLLQNEEKASLMGEEAKEFVLKNFDYATLTKSFVSFYQSLIP